MTFCMVLYEDVFGGQRKTKRLGDSHSHAGEWVRPSKEKWLEVVLELLLSARPLACFLEKLFEQGTFPRAPTWNLSTLGNGGRRSAKSNPVLAS